MRGGGECGRPAEQRGRAEQRSAEWKGRRSRAGNTTVHHARSARNHLPLCLLTRCRCCCARTLCRASLPLCCSLCYACCALAISSVEWVSAALDAPLQMLQQAIQEGIALWASCTSDGGAGTAEMLAAASAAASDAPLIDPLATLAAAATSAAASAAASAASDSAFPSAAADSAFSATSNFSSSLLSDSSSTDFDAWFAAVLDEIRSTAAATLHELRLGCAVPVEYSAHWESYGECYTWSLGVVLLGFLMWMLYYLCRAAVRPTVYTQHPAGSEALCTQRPPVAIDVGASPAIGAVAHAVSVSSGSAFGRFVGERYCPTPWLTFPYLSGHLQTIYASRSSARTLRTPLVTYKRELLAVEAGSANTLAGQVALDWAVLGKSRSSAPESPVTDWSLSFTDRTPTVILVHGLAGGSREHYIKNFVWDLSDRLGYRCVVFNARGCGGSAIISPQLYCGAYTDDLRQVVANISARLPEAPLLAVGFSLGANILSKYVGEEGLAGRPAPFAAVVAIANPFDFLHGARHLDSNFIQQRVYSANLAKSLITLFSNHVDVLRGAEKRRHKEERKQEREEARMQGLSEEAYRQLHPHRSSPPAAAPVPVPAPESWDPSVFSSPTLREFDKRLTRVVFGYATVDDYYRDASSSRFIKFIGCPILFVNAADDPISDSAAWPLDEICINPHAVLLTTPCGGHSMDHVTGAWATSSWTVRAARHWFADVMQFRNAAETDKLGPGEAARMMTPPPAAPVSASAACAATPLDDSFLPLNATAASFAVGSSESFDVSWESSASQPTASVSEQSPLDGFDSAESVDSDSESLRLQREIQEALLMQAELTALETHWTGQTEEEEPADTEAELP